MYQEGSVGRTPKDAVYLSWVCYTRSREPFLAQGPPSLLGRLHASSGCSQRQNKWCDGCECTSMQEPDVFSSKHHLPPSRQASGVNWVQRYLLARQTYLRRAWTVEVAWEGGTMRGLSREAWGDAFDPELPRVFYSCVLHWGTGLLFSVVLLCGPLYVPSYERRETTNLHRQSKVVY